MSACNFTPVWLSCPDCGLEQPCQLEEGATHIVAVCPQCGSKELEGYELPPADVGEWSDVDWSQAPAWARQDGTR